MSTLKYVNTKRETASNLSPRRRKETVKRERSFQTDVIDVLCVKSDMPCTENILENGSPSHINVFPAGDINVFWAVSTVRALEQIPKQDDALDERDMHSLCWEAVKSFTAEVGETSVRVHVIKEVQFTVGWFEYDIFWRDLSYNKHINWISDDGTGIGIESNEDNDEVVEVKNFFKKGLLEMRRAQDRSQISIHLRN